MLLALIGAAIAGLVAPMLISLARAAYDSQMWGRWALWPAGILLALTVSVGIWRHGWPVLGIPHFWRYPPTWVALAIGVSLLGVFWLLVPGSLGVADPERLDVGASTWAMLIGLPFAAVVLAGVVAELVRWRGRNASTDDPGMERVGMRAEAFPASSEELFDWIREDKPIYDPKTDAFGHSRMAQRIARRLASEASGSTAVLGDFGMGKTSLAQLVEHLLGRATYGPPVRFMRVSLWHFDSTEAVVRGILDRLVAELAKEVSAPALWRLPSEYVALVEGVSGRWASVLQPFQARRDADALLASFDEVAEAVDRHFVLWIEDLERFAGAQGSTERYEERIAPVRALLHLLDKQRMVTVIVASTTLQTRIDIEKIARYVERIPALDEIRVATIIQRFRKQCRQQIGEEIDPARRDAREEDFGSSVSVGVLSGLLPQLLNMVPTPLAALAVMCRTPRALKQGLRRTDEIWESLRGEIDFDELLSMSVLREADPEVFALVDRYFEVLRNGDSVYQGAKKKDSLFKDELHKATEKRGPRYQNAVKKILETVFGDIDNPGPRSGYHPQGLAVRAHVNYWQRFLAEEKVQPEDSDQRLIRVIRQAMSSDDADLPELLDLLEDEERWPAIMLFGRHFLTTRQLSRWIVALAQRRADEKPQKWPLGVLGQPDPPGLDALRNLARDLETAASVPNDELADAVVRAYKVSIPRNLWFAVRLDRDFVMSLDDTSMLLEGRCDNLHRRLRDILRQYYENKPDKLAERLDGLNPFTLRWVCWGPRHAQEGRFEELPFEEWPSFARTVLEAGGRNPSIMLPQIARMLTKDDDMSDGTKLVKYDSARGAHLFDTEALQELFLRHECADDDEYCQEVKKGLRHDQA